MFGMFHWLLNFGGMLIDFLPILLLVVLPLAHFIAKAEQYKNMR
jgi:hypothetical protein